MAQNLKKELMKVDEEISKFRLDPFNEDLNTENLFASAILPKDKVLRDEAEDKLIIYKMKDVNT